MTGKFLFVLTDGGRARLVEQSPETHQFVTVEEIDNGAQLRRLRSELRASPPARTFNSQGDRRHAVGPEDDLRSAKEEFVSRIAARACEVVRRRNLDAVVLAAPKRLVGPLRRHLRADVSVADVVSKDLTKAPDHELGRWLSGLGRGTHHDGSRP